METKRMKQMLRTDKHGGTVHIYPEDKNSLLQGIVNIKGKKCLNMKDIHEICEYLELEYKGDTHTGLDALGIKKVS